MAPAEAASAFSRRTLLKGSLAGAALLAVGGAAIALQRSRLRALPGEALHVLTPQEYAVLAAIAERMLPRAKPADTATGMPAVPGAQNIDVALLADRLLETVQSDVVDGIKLALGVIESGLTGALFFERVRPFTQLEATEQDRVLLAFRDSKVGLRRTIYRSFAGLTGSLYYGDPRVWPSVGYAGPPSASGLREAYAAQLVDYNALRAKSG